MQKHQQSLPPFYLITPDFTDNKPTLYLSKLTQALKNGIRLVQFRSKQLPEAYYLSLVHKILPIVNHYKGTLLLNGNPDLLKTIKAHGIHLTSHQANQLTQRPISTNKLLSIACHNLKELRQAEHLDADIITLSPVFQTPSSPKSQIMALGWQAFKTIAHCTNIPIYALGGLGTHDYTMAKQSGAYGIAAIRGLWHQTSVLELDYPTDH